MVEPLSALGKMSSWFFILPLMALIVEITNSCSSRYISIENIRGYFFCSLSVESKSCRQIGLSYPWHL